MNCSSSASVMALSAQQVLLNLPPGWRLHPTDEGVLLDYLKPKILGDADLLSGTGIQEINILHYNPADLLSRFITRSCDKELCFLSPAEYYENSKLRKRKVRGRGSWKPTGDPRPITVGDSDEVIGTKRSLVYHNPDATEFKATEYIYTAQLHRPITGDYVFYKLKRKPIKKKAAVKKSVKAEPACKKTTPNKRARKVESSNCSTVSALVSASDSASAFKDKNSKDIIASPAYGEGEQSIHMASDLENQYPNVMTAMSTYEKGKSSYLEASDFDNQNLISTSVSNIGATGSLMDSYIGNQNSDKTTIVSTCNKGDMGCAVFCDSEYLIPNKITNTLLYNRSIPSCQTASCVENQNLYDVSNVSSNNKDETLDCDFHNQNPFSMTTELLYDQSNTSYLVTSDFEAQNPTKKMDISASIEGQWSPPTTMPSDFDNQNQYQKTDVSFLEDCHSLSMASKVGNTTFQEVQSHYNRADMPNLENHAGPLEASTVGETFKEVQSRSKETDMSDRAHELGGFLMDSDSEEDITILVENPQGLEQMMASLHSELHPIHSNESPHNKGTPSHDNNIQGPSAASNEGESTIPVREDEHMEKLLDCFY